MRYGVAEFSICWRIFRTRRIKAASTLENIESVATGQGSSHGKKALYHCNYCNKDITGKIRIKCAMCPDFDLCIECFSVGAEVDPHKSNHPYRVMDNLSFPLICPDWNADEETLLLEGIEIYGLGNWAEVAEHVGTKGRSECIDHYNSIYINSPCFPLPDLSHLVGKNREELLAMTKEQNDLNKDSHPDRSVEEKKHRVPADEGPPITNLFGYNPKRHEFEIEYDNNAEQLLVDMEFKETDTVAEREIKLQVLRIYSRRLDERNRRKDFVLERNLIYPDPFEKDLSPEEKQICEHYRVFMRFHSKQEHEELLRTVIDEHRLRKKMLDLQEAKAAGCRTSAEAKRYIALKRKAEADESTSKLRETVEANRRGKGLIRANHHTGVFPNKDSVPMTTGQLMNSSLNEWDITGFPGADMLSENEKKLCCEMRILPSDYLNMLQTLSMEIMKGNVVKKSDAHGLFNVDPTKVDRVYDMLVKKGIAQP